VDNLYGKNKDYISYSSYTLWKQNKDAYRRKYYDGGESISSPELVFGKKIARLLEDKELDHIEKYKVMEQKIMVEIDGVKVLSYLDSYQPYKFLEYKTGVVSWTKTRVQKHLQLDWYSLMIQKWKGKVQDQCKLIWIETTKEKINYHGHKIEGGIRLTGKVEVFKRSVKQWERDLLEKEIIKTAHEIRRDYKETLQRHGKEVTEATSKK